MLRAWECTGGGPSARDHRLVYHSRPQDLVFDAGDQDQEDAQEWIRHLVEAGQIGEEVEDVRVRRRLGTWQGRVACTRYIRDLEADDLLDITGMLTPQEQTAYTSQPVSPPPHSPVYTSQPVSPPPHSPTAVPSPATSTPVLPPLAPPLPSRLPSPMPLPPQEHPPQVLPYGAPWTPLVEQAIPQPHT